MPFPLKMIVWIIGVFIAIVIVGLIVRGFLSSPSIDMTEERDASTISELQQYFREEIVTRGVSNVGQPIEGFDSGMLISAFPGLQEEDFDEVETSEGYYEYTNGTLRFVRVSDRYITSAERAVSNAGYAQLLDNVVKRLGVALTSRASIEEIIKMIDTRSSLVPQIFQTRMNETVVALGVTVTPFELIEDSRCPVDVECVQAGTVRLKTRLSDELGDSIQIFSLGQPVTTEVTVLTLSAVEPLPRSTLSLEANDYIFTFTVQRRPPLLP